MKKQLLLLIFAFFMVFSLAVAQKGNAEKRAAVYTDQLTKQLSLSADQKAKVLAINTEANRKIDAAQAKKDNAGARAARQKRRKDIEALLTPKQKAEFAKNFGGGKDD